MTRRSGRGVSIYVLLVALSASLAGQEEARKTFRASTGAVRVDVSVQKEGRPFAGLTTRDFQVFDNEIVQNVTDVSFGKLPIDVTVALDVSTSVSGQLLSDLRQAIEQLYGRLQPDDRLKLLTFNMRVRRVLDFVPRSRGSRIRFDVAVGSGSTSLLDTLAVALTSPAPADRRQLVIAFSDGRDTSSVSDPGVVLDVARRTTPTVAFVSPQQPRPVSLLRGPSTAGVLPPASSAGGSVDQVTGVNREIPRPGVLSPANDAVAPFYRQLVSETGGVVVPLPDVRGVSLASTFNRILDEFRSSYVLHFTPEGPARKGFHTIRVTIKSAERLEVRARRGYVEN